MGASARLTNEVGTEFFFKNDGLNPSASFKDRGMAAAVSYLNMLMRKKGLTELLSVCASTGDTSAAAALYASFLSGRLKSAVLLPTARSPPSSSARP